MGKGSASSGFLANISLAGEKRMVLNVSFRHGKRNGTEVLTPLRPYKK